MLIGGAAARAALQRQVAARQPAALSFDIRPQGDIYVDDVLKGRATSILYLPLAAGTYRIEVRNGHLPPFITMVELDPGEQMQLQHSFITPVPQRRRNWLDKMKFWR
jgi:non-specific serine/threonine protein kinase